MKGWKREKKVAIENQAINANANRSEIFEIHMRIQVTNENKKCKCDMNEAKEKLVKSGIKVKRETKLGRDKKKETYKNQLIKQ